MKTAMQFSVYILPKERYCGTTGRDIKKRLLEHEHIKNRNIACWKIIAVFDNKKEALEFEKNYQIRYKYNGYQYDDKWRKVQSKKLLTYGEDKIYSKKRKPVMCIDTGLIYKGVRDCERKLFLSSGNLSRHLNGAKTHTHINGLKFKYYE